MSNEFLDNIEDILDTMEKLPSDFYRRFATRARISPGTKWPACGIGSFIPAPPAALPPWPTDPLLAQIPARRGPPRAGDEWREP